MTADTISLLVQAILIPMATAMWVEIRRLNKVVAHQEKLIGQLDERIKNCLERQ